MEKYSTQAVLNCIQHELQLDSISEDDEMQRTRNWDSMGQVSLLLKLEDEFNIKFPADQFGILTSVKSILSYFSEEGILADG
ncbi:MAG: acyl carrier protein [Methylobacter sp.]